MENKFTAGPWQIITVTDREIGKDLGMDTIAPYLISGADEIQIARVDDEFTNRLTPTISALANAHLIAAAPELLESLKGLIDAISNLATVETTITKESIPEARTKVLKARIAAQHAINKALNKQS